jgi:Response regulators consisting of a CheY-like receiver domain and a winged-helix DNA-binding domain
MSTNVLSIGLSDTTNKKFREHFSMVDRNLIVCRELPEAFRELNRDSFCLIIMDASDLNTGDTQDAVSKLRNTTFVPLLVLTSYDAAAPTLDVGADVCMPLTDECCTLFMQAMALIRRFSLYNRYDAYDPETATLYRADLVIDSLHHRVTQGGVEIKLLPREFRLLRHFACNPGIVLTPEKISRAIWLMDQTANRDVTKVISDLRHKLNDSKEEHRYIETVHGVGYRFCAN